MIGNNVDIQGNCRIYSPEEISLGDNIVIGQGALIEGMGGVTFGNNVILGPDVTIWSANHNYYAPTSLPYDEKVIKKSVTIEDNVWIGAKSILTPGVTVHEGAIIAMGAVVCKDVPKGAVVGGNPARIIKYRDIECYERLVLNKQFYLNKKIREN